ncbi:hypothetical protein GGI11_007362, partial [Coemansia sp. RSA 2049]
PGEHQGDSVCGHLRHLIRLRWKQRQWDLAAVVCIAAESGGLCHFAGIARASSHVPANVSVSPPHILWRCLPASRLRLRTQAAAVDAARAPAATAAPAADVRLPPKQQAAVSAALRPANPAKPVRQAASGLPGSTAAPRVRHLLPVVLPQPDQRHPALIIAPTHDFKADASSSHIPCLVLKCPPL